MKNFIVKLICFPPTLWLWIKGMVKMNFEYTVNVWRMWYRITK